MDTLSKKNAFRKMSTALRVAPWTLLICVFILANFLLFFDFSASKKETSTATYLIKEKGASLIHSFEATLFSATRLENKNIENILIEHADRNDIFFLAIVDTNGVVIIASDKSLIGQKILKPMGNSATSSFVNGNVKTLNISKNGNLISETVFLVDKQLFVSRTSINQDNQRKHKMRRHRENSRMLYMAHMPHANKQNPGDTRSKSRRLAESFDDCDDARCTLRRLLKSKDSMYMAVGFDMEDIVTAQNVDNERSFITQLVFLFLLTLGVFSFFILRAYQRSYTMAQEGKAYILSLMDALPLGIIILDHNNTVLTMNPNAENLTAHKESKSLGKNIAELIPQFYKEDFKTNLENMTITMHHSSENPMTVEVNSFPIITNNEQQGHGIILRNLHEIQKLQEELHRQERLASIGKLAAGIAHEIRNPLGSIKGLARIFEENAEKESEDAKLAAIMTQEVMRVDKVVSDLLELSKPNTIFIKKANLKQLIEKAENSILFQNKIKITFTHKLCSQCEDIFLDENRILQVLQNIFLNSIQAMHQDGSIHIKARYIQEKILHNDNKDEDNLQNNIYTQNKRYHGNLLEIIISDNGKGISKEKIKNLFTPYYTDKAKGTGLGLVMVQKIIQAHNGSVSVESEENIGTKVILRIPQ